MNFQSLFFHNFKIKYLINSNVTYYHNKWGVCLHSKGHGVKPHKWCMHGQQW
jgi:hypothetical protein